MEKPLRKRELIKELFSKGKVIKSKNFTFRYLNQQDKRQNVSFVIPSKIVPKATDRNKIKRRGKYIVSKLNIKDSFAGVFTGKPGINKAKFGELEQEILVIMSKITN